MKKENMVKISIYVKIFIIIFSIILLILNLNVISVIHARESESLPVLKYETYSSIELSLYYFIILLAAFNIVLTIIERLNSIKPYFIALTPIISIILLIFLLINPHSMIINPTGWPPTQLDVLESGGIFGIILLIILTIDSILMLYKEGFLKKYFYIIAIVVLSFLLSDFLHESGHAFFILISGGIITQFYPFPVLMGGEFNAGFVSYINVPPSFEPLVLLGGEIFQWIVIGIISIILYLHNPKKPLRYISTILLVVAILDFPLYTINNSVELPHWILIGSSHGDIIIFSALTGFPLFILILLAIVQLILGALLIYYLIYKRRSLFFDKNIEI